MSIRESILNLIILRRCWCSRIKGNVFWILSTNNGFYVILSHALENPSYLFPIYNYSYFGLLVPDGLTWNWT